jgi:hypothetical protein
MWGNLLAEATALPGFATGCLHGAGGHVEMGTPGRKQPGGAGAQDAEVGTEDFQRAGGKHGVAVLATLDAKEHALVVDVGDFEGDGFGDTESGAIAGEQDGAMFDTVDVVEEPLDLIGGEDDGELFVEAGAWKIVSVPGHLQGDQVQELDGGDESIDGLGRLLALLRQMELVLTDGFELEFGGIAVEIFRKTGDIMDVASLCSGGEVADAHVFDHALA